MSRNRIGRELRQQLVRTFDDPKYRPPPLPKVALDLVILCGREDVSLDEVVRLLERDKMLTGAVMKLIASPIYAGRATINSLRDAVVRLGVRTVRDVVFEAALRENVFKVPEYSETVEGIQRHSTVTAYLRRVVCRHARVNAEHAFLCGLLHDVGFAALLFALAARKERPDLSEVWHHLDETHELASKHLTKLWKLPVEISVVVGMHHRVHTGATARIAAVINVADRLSGRFGASIVGPTDASGVPLPADGVTLSETHDSESVLQLDDAVLNAIVAEAETVVAHLAL
jgi:HD-like signal output (HDOD) protein